jgi:hypothetical protein
MSETHISFHRLEEFQSDPNKHWAVDIICSFETKQYGYFKVGCSLVGDSDGQPMLELEELEEEPSLYLLTERAQAYVKRVMYIVWRMIYDSSTATDRFK